MQDTDELLWLRQIKSEVEEIDQCEKTIQILKKRLSSGKSANGHPASAIQHSKIEKAVIRKQIQKRAPKWRRISVILSLLYSMAYMPAVIILLSGMTAEKSSTGEIADLPLALILTAVWFCTVTCILALRER